MKIVIATLATVVGLLALPNTAEARSPKHCDSGHTYRSGYSSCGCAIYTKRIISGYDCYRRPIYRYHSVPIVHRCHSKHKHYHSKYRSSYGRHGYHGYHNKYSHRKRHYGHYGHHRYGSHISFRTSYGNVRICR
jgi:hypothetical protein